MWIVSSDGEAHAIIPIGWAPSQGHRLQMLLNKWNVFKVRF